jgi:DNA-binding Xre family transcriptional regulator
MKNQVDSTIAQKKVQLLLQKGYSYRELANHTELDLNTIKNVSRGKSKMIKYTTHLAIEKVYAEEQARELYEEEYHDFGGKLEQDEADGIQIVNDFKLGLNILKIIVWSFMICSGIILTVGYLVSLIK